MQQRRRNPFHYGSPAVGDHFVDRQDELADITSRMVNGQNVILLSPRRYGKTSLLRAALAAAERQGARVGYAYLLRCSSVKDVAETLLTSVMNGPLSWLAREREQLVSLLARVRPGVTVEFGDKPSFRFAATVESDYRTILKDVVRLLGQASQHDRPVALVMDEFQRVAEIDPNLPSVFKELADELVGVSLTFSGSKLHVMRQMAVGAGAPLLGMGERISLRIVPRATMVGFVIDRAASAGVVMTSGAAELLFDLVDGIPNDVQRLAYEAFFLASTVIDDEVVREAMSRVVDHLAVDYEESYSDLAPSQQRVLRELARRPVAAVYARDFLTAVEVANANAVRTALTVLEQRELVVRRERTWSVADPFLRSWLKDG